MNTQSPHYSTQFLLPIISVETQTSVQVNGKKKKEKIFYLCDEFHRTIFFGYVPENKKKKPQTFVDFSFSRHNLCSHSNIFIRPSPIKR